MIRVKFAGRTGVVELIATVPTARHPSASKNHTQTQAGSLGAVAIGTVFLVRFFVYLLNQDKTICVHQVVFLDRKPYILKIKIIMKP